MLGLAWKPALFFVHRETPTSSFHGDDKMGLAGANWQGTIGDVAMMLVYAFQLLGVHLGVQTAIQAT